ncbi:MAG: hypothetical protein C6H99_07185 [Epsilonproteobacteria bacterium]|nr:hypothetical protein [Campylobacterota bacterium]NPA63706.1 hypothetical protein [Campylobacterota bacterium]
MKRALLFVATLLFAEVVQEIPIGRIYTTNAYIQTQKRGAQDLMAVFGGHIKELLVKEGQQIEANTPIAIIDSPKLASLSAKYLSLKKELQALTKRLERSRSLYKKGLISFWDLSELQTALEKKRALLDRVVLELDLVGLRPKKVVRTYILKAHAGGVVQRIFVTPHSNIAPNQKILRIESQKGYVAVAFLSPQEALGLKNPKGTFHFAHRSYQASFIQILPRVDEVTKQAKILFALPEGKFLIGAYGVMQIRSEGTRSYKVVKKEALSMFEGEWVIFVPKHEDDQNDHHDHHHEEHETKEPPYVPLPVRLIEFVGDWALIDGVQSGQEYVAKDVYKIKASLLKSRLSGHGH